MSKTFASAAPALYDAGYNTVPIRPGEKRPPERLRWRRWLTSRQTADDFQKVSESFSACDVAIVVGNPRAGGLVDLEVDGPQGEEGLRRAGPLPDTATFRACRGPHRLYRHSSPLRPLKGLGFEVRTRGLVVVPPSTGREWMREIEALAPLPQEWVDLLAQRSAAASSNDSFTSGPSVAPHLHSLSLFHFTPCPTSLLVRKDGDCRTDGRLLAALSAPAVFPRVAEVLGLPLEMKKTFRCPLHRDASPSATLVRGNNGAIVLHDWHGPDHGAPPILTLPEVLAAFVSGTARKIRGPELVLWGLRLAQIVGLVEAPVVALPELPDARDHVQRVLAGWQALVAVKTCALSTFSRDATPFTVRFAAWWSGVTKAQAEAAIPALRRSGVLIPHGQWGKATLYAIPMGLERDG